MIDHTNDSPSPDESAESGSAVVEFYSKECLTDDDGDTDSTVSDLLTDLMHFCTREGIDFDTCLDRAKRNFIVEELPMEQYKTPQQLVNELPPEEREKTIALAAEFGSQEQAKNAASALGTLVGVTKAILKG